MRLFKIPLLICGNNLRKWATNYRVWCILLLVIVVSHMMIKEVGLFAQVMDIKVSPWLYPFVCGQKYVKLLFMFPFILLLCDAPFVDSDYQYVLIRSGRTPCGVGHILYIAASTALYQLLLIISSVAVIFTNVQLMDDWGKILTTLAKTFAGYEFGVKLLIDSYIIDYFTPMQAMWFTFYLSLLVGIVLGLIIYVVNMLTENKLMGILAASALLLFDASIEGMDHLVWLSPASWCSLSKIGIESYSALPSFGYVQVVLITLIVILSASVLILGKKRQVNIIPQV